MNTHKKTQLPVALSAALLAATLALVPTARASILTASDGVTGTHFGEGLSLSGNNALVGAYRDGGTEVIDSAYYYKGLDGQSGMVTQSVKLIASDRAINDYFGMNVSLSGDSALVSAHLDDDKGDKSGSAYYYKGLNGKSGTVTQNVKLVASDGAKDDKFGDSVSLAGVNALVGSIYDDDKGDSSGSAYYFKNLNSKSGTVNQDVKLLASDGKASGLLGSTVSLVEDNALVGARGDSKYKGAAYYYKGLNSVSGNSTGVSALNGKNATNENVKLVASDAVDYDYLGDTISLSSDNALVSTYQKDSYTGTVYYYKGLNSKGGTITEDVKLLASDAATGKYFGHGLALSGDNALVGASRDTDKGYNAGAVYYFKGLSNATGTVTEDVKLLASDGVGQESFGAYSVGLDGDRFVVGAYAGKVNGVNTGKVYSGDIRAFTTLNAGDTRLATDGLSLVSRTDWVIGATTSDNIVTLSRTRNIATADPSDYVSDTADVTADGKAVYIGQTAGANNNFLIIEGTLTANAVHVGTAGSSNNFLAIARTGQVTADELVVAASNVIVFDLGASGVNGLIDATSITFGGTLSLAAGDDFVAVGGATYQLFDFDLVSGSSEFASIVSDADAVLAEADLKWDFSTLYTNGTISIVAAAVPEPATYAALAALAILACAALRRRKS